MPLTRLAEYFRNLQGWKAYAHAFGLGVALTAAFPPFWLLPLAVVAFTCWLWMAQGEHRRRRRFAIGWWFGFGHHTTGLYWICIALGIDGGAFWWMMPFALCVLPAYLALYTGLVSMVIGFRNLRPFEQVLFFAVLWLAMEYIRAHLFYGFPWNLAGYIWTLSDVTLQPASLIGVYGMTLWAVLFCAAFALLARPAGGHPLSRDNRIRGFVALMLLSAGLTGWGAWRLSQAETLVQGPGGAKVRIVQASVEQSLKWDPAFQLEGLQRHINLSTLPADDRFAPDYIVWPETAMPYALREGSNWVEVLANIAPADGALITGVVRYEGNPQSWRVWNSIQAVDQQTRIVDSYDKHILVPFGEFVPLRGMLSFLPIEKITHGSTDFSQGSGPSLIELEGKAPRVQPLICYEAIFSGFRTVDKADRPDWLLNVTNDAWFGVSTGPYQHLHMARTRAVERGIPLVRAANTGISAAFDAFGREIGRIGLNEQNIMDIALPARTGEPTWYSRYGDATILFVFYLLLGYCLRPRAKDA